VDQGCIWLYGDKAETPFACISADHVVAVEKHSQVPGSVFLVCSHGRYQVLAESVAVAAQIMLQAKSGERVSMATLNTKLQTTY
jgi:hypothetical protein